MIEYLNKVNSHSDLVALCFDNETYTYQQVIDRVEYYYDKSSELKPGSIVSIISDYSFESISLFFALAKRKCIIAPIVSANTGEVAKRENEILPDATVTIQDKGEAQFSYHENLSSRHDLINEIRTKEHAGLILFSSGSTGKPKAMIHDLNILSSTYIDKKPKKLSIMVFLMFDHIGGLNTLLNSMSIGAKIVIPTKREPEHVAFLIEREKVNLLPASPTFLNMMLIAGVQHSFNLRSLRMITYGTEAMPESLLARLKQEWPRVKLLQTFGTSETGIAQTSSRSSSSLEIRIDDPNQEFKVVNGELWLRSKTQILGYLNHDMSGFSDDGWFKTGDLVEESEDGYLKIVGRLKEVINVGGEKVLPSEVESCILEVSGVADCVVYAVANAITGQTVATNVVLDAGVNEKVVKKEIRKHCKANLDRYKVPTKMVFSEDAAIGERFKKIRLNKYEV